MIRRLGLLKATNTLIGDEMKRGISGGEKRRVAIGVQLLSNPSVIFLDEPTSGLDSFQADSVVSTLKMLAEQGTMVISSIHQPRSSIFQRYVCTCMTVYVISVWSEFLKLLSMIHTIVSFKFNNSDHTGLITLYC